MLRRYLASMPSLNKRLAASSIETPHASAICFTNAISLSASVVSSSFITSALSGALLRSLEQARYRAEIVLT